MAIARAREMTRAIASETDGNAVRFQTNNNPTLYLSSYMNNSD